MYVCMHINVCGYLILRMCMYVCMYVWHEIERGSDERINEEKEGLWELVRILLGAGVDKARVNKRGDTALNAALRETNLTAVHALTQDIATHTAATTGIDN